MKRLKSFVILTQRQDVQGSFEEAKGLFYIGYYQSSVHHQNDA